MSYLSFLSSSFADSAGESLVVEDVVAVLVLVELEVPRRVRCEVRSGLRAVNELASKNMLVIGIKLFAAHVPCTPLTFLARQK